MLHPLDLKLLRDIGKMKGQMVAVSIVMACGLAMMIMSRSLILSLESTRDAYYADYRFAELFCDLKRAPNALRNRLAEIPGVAAVETRVKGKVTLDLPGLDEPADGIIHSIPEDRPQQLNLLFLRRGRLPELVKAQDTEDGKGVKVLDVEDESAADKAGIKEDDIITEFDGKKVNNAQELATAAREAKDKPSVKITLIRDGKTQTIEVKTPKKLRTANL